LSRITWFKSSCLGSGSKELIPRTYSRNTRFDF